MRRSNASPAAAHAKLLSHIRKENNRKDRRRSEAGSQVGERWLVDWCSCECVQLGSASAVGDSHDSLWVVVASISWWLRSFLSCPSSRRGVCFQSANALALPTSPIPAAPCRWMWTRRRRRAAGSPRPPAQLALPAAASGMRTSSQVCPCCAVVAPLLADGLGRTAGFQRGAAGQDSCSANRKLAPGLRHCCCRHNAQDPS